MDHDEICGNMFIWYSRVTFNVTHTHKQTKAESWGHKNTQMYTKLGNKVEIKAICSTLVSDCLVPPHSLSHTHTHQPPHTTSHTHTNLHIRHHTHSSWSLWNVIH
ncbi:hypothetical protein PAMP_018570 [Pampus punctatissimus]